MKLLLDLEQRHQSATGIVGSLSGLAAWILAHSTEITNIAGAVGAVATATIAVLAVLIKCYSIGSQIYEFFRDRKRARNARRQHAADVEADNLDL